MDAETKPSIADVEDALDREAPADEWDRLFAKLPRYVVARLRAKAGANLDAEIRERARRAARAEDLAGDLKDATGTVQLVAEGLVYASIGPDGEENHELTALRHAAAHANELAEQMRAVLGGNKPRWRLTLARAD